MHQVPLGKESIIVPIYKKGIKQIVIIIGAYHFYQLHTRFYLTSCFLNQVHIQRKLLGITKVDLDATGRLLSICSAFGKYWRKNGNTMNIISLLSLVFPVN